MTNEFADGGNRLGIVIELLKIAEHAANSLGEVVPYRDRPAADETTLRFIRAAVDARLKERKRLDDAWKAHRQEEMPTSQEKLDV